MISLFMVIFQLFTLGFSQPGLIPQVLQERSDIPAGQGLAADIVNQRPSSAPSIVLPPPTVVPPSGNQGQGQGQGQGTPPTVVPPPGPQGQGQGQGQGIPPTAVPPSGNQGQGQGQGQGTPPGNPGQGTPLGTPVPNPGLGTPLPQIPTIPPVIIGRPIVPAPARRIPTPDPKVVVVAPKPVVIQKDPTPVRVVKQVPPPIVSKKSAHGIILTIVPGDKCVKLEDILKDTQFSILARALEVAKLEQPNKKENTIFAPTNAAFEKLAERFGATLEEILNDPNLNSILLYHFVPGKLLKAADLKNKQKLETRLKNQKLQVDKSQKNVVKIEAFASIAKVVKADVKACDLIIHVIDTVLLPEV